MSRGWRQGSGPTVGCVSAFEGASASGRQGIAGPRAGGTSLSLSLHPDRLTSSEFLHEKRTLDQRFELLRVTILES